MHESFEQRHPEREKQEKVFITVLQNELRDMETRRPETRKNGKGDAKYRILFQFLRSAEKQGFQGAYDSLQDFEKHAIVTRLENQAYHGNIPRDFVENFRLFLYGTVEYKGSKRLNRTRQSELEDQVQNSDEDKI